MHTLGYSDSDRPLARRIRADPQSGGHPSEGLLVIGRCCHSNGVGSGAPKRGWLTYEAAEDPGMQGAPERNRR